MNQYVFLVVLATGWSLLLIFLSMVIHDYDVKNAITRASLAGINAIFIACLLSILAKSLAL